MTDWSKTVDIDELAALVPDGASLVSPSDANGVPMAATRALIRHGVRDLILIGGPTSGLQADLLIGAGQVAAIETAAVTLGEFGGAPRFRDAIQSGALVIRDSTCPAIHGALQAAEKGSPFMPLRGLIGSDLLKARPDWVVIDNPYTEAEHDPIVLLPAIVPDIALIHTARADRQGNVWIGARREAMTMAHAARKVLVTVEELVDDNLMDNPETAPGTLPALYVDAVTHSPMGAWPLAFGDRYGADAAHMAGYAREARTQAGFDRYIEQYVAVEPPLAAE
jgi:glutaconate CoA-transferase subunit A